LASSPLKVIEFDRASEGVEGEVVGTNFERKYREEGRALYATAGMKT